MVFVQLAYCVVFGGVYFADSFATDGWLSWVNFILGTWFAYVFARVAWDNVKNS